MIHRLRLSKEKKVYKAIIEKHRTRGYLEFNFNDWSKISLKLIGWGEWGLDCANRLDEEWTVVVPVGQTLLAPVFACWFIRCCARAVGDLECICLKAPRDLPHTYSRTWCLFKNKKNGKKLIALLVLKTRELQKFIRTNFNLTKILTQSRLD